MIRARTRNRTGSHAGQHGRDLDIPRKAQIAIADGVQRGDAVAELEYLGLPVRTINILEESKYQITRLEDLLGRRRDELLEIPNFGENTLGELLDCLSRYNRLDEAKQRRKAPPVVKPKWFGQ